MFFLDEKKNMLYSFVGRKRKGKFMRFDKRKILAVLLAVLALLNAGCYHGGDASSDTQGGSDSGYEDSGSGSGSSDSGLLGGTSNGGSVDSGSSDTGAIDSGVWDEEDEKTLEVTKFTSPQIIVCKTLAEYMQSPFETVLTDIDKYGEHELHKGRYVEIGYQKLGFTANDEVAAAEVVFWEKGARTPRYVPFSIGKETVKIYNLKTAMKYTFEVRVTLKSGKHVGGRGEFETANTPRLMNAEGVHNLRDIGGWKTTDGYRIKQGVLYRGTELDGRVEPTYYATERGRETMRTVFGIKSEMDLRDPVATWGENAPTVSLIGEDIPITYYNATMYNGIHTESGKENMKRIFQDLAKPQNYPVYLHCTYGCDRTGTVCMLLEGLLGVSFEDVVRDYELSSLFALNVTRRNCAEFLDTLQALEGETFQGKIVGYLLSIGLTAGEIANIRSVFLEKV